MSRWWILRLSTRLLGVIYHMQNASMHLCLNSTTLQDEIAKCRGWTKDSLNPMHTGLNSPLCKMTMQNARGKHPTFHFPQNYVKSFFFLLLSLWKCYLFNWVLYGSLSPLRCCKTCPYKGNSNNKVYVVQNFDKCHNFPFNVLHDNQQTRSHFLCTTHTIDPSM